MLGLLNGGTISEATSYGFANTGLISVTDSGTNGNAGSAIGGFIGQIESGALSGASNTFTNSIPITASYASNIGGVFGWVAGGTIPSTDSFTNNSAGTINSSAPAAAINVGGVIGQSAIALSNNMTNQALVTGTTSVGGVIGLISAGNISGALSSSVAITGGTDVGGMVGSLTGGTLSSSSFTYTGTSVTGLNNVGGMLGLLNGGTISEATSYGYTNTGLTSVTDSGTNGNAGSAIGWIYWSN